MAVSTANAVLRRVIVDWRDSFMGVTSDQEAGDIQSSLQNLCIDALVAIDELPPALHDLYVEARRRARGLFARGFDTPTLIRTANEALSQL